MKKFGKQLKLLRIYSKLSRRVLAKKIGVNYQTIYRWEHNFSDIKSNKLVLLSKIFTVTTDFLLGRKK